MGGVREQAARLPAPAGAPEDERERVGRVAQTFFEQLWRRGDPWDFEHSEFERAKYARQLALVEDRRYGRVLEIGCGAGCFSARLARLADHVVALDVAPSAIARARASARGTGVVDFRVANVMDYDVRAEGPWDLVVLSETIYYLGWLYPFFDVAWLAAEIFAATASGGRLLMANTCGREKDYLMRPWLLRTYRDLFVNVGYRVEVEATFRGVKHGVELTALLSRLGKDREGDALDEGPTVPEGRG